MKRRTLTLMICLLSVLSLVSVGFASWIITANDTQEAEGNIQIETVTDNRVFIVDIVNPSDIVFGAPKTPDEFANPWFTAKKMADENLSATITFDVQKKDGTSIARSNVNITASVEVKDTEGKTFEELVSAGYIEAVPTVTVSDSAYSITISLNWGAKWGNKNPYNYYNGHKVTDEITTGVTYGDHAAEHIAAFAALNDLEYVVTITAAAK